MISTSQPSTPIDLRSGWDDTFDFKKSKMKPKAKAAALASASYSLPTTPEEDASFTASTLTYLESPVAHTLGLPGQTQVPSWPQRRESLKPEAQSPDANSLLRASWPSPPIAVPRPSSPTSVSADGHTFGYPLYPTITPPHLRTQPFQGRTVAEIPSVPVVKHARRLSSRSFSSLRSTGSRPQSREKAGGYAPNDVIYMTVVKETTEAV
jgi:hypothetical protein